jgi:hypothetical protein
MTTLSLANTATTHDILKGHKAIQVGGHSFINLTVTEYCGIAPIPTNRDSQRRVPKMRKIFDEAYLNDQISTLTEVAVGIVVEDFEDAQSKYQYKKGDWYCVDGNTRRHYWTMYPDRATSIAAGLTAKIHYLKSIDDVKYAYYPYNNAKSTEKASEILQGLARRYNWTPRQTVFANGGYKSALDWASAVPGEDKPDVFEAFHSQFEGLKILDSIPKDATHTITKPYLDGLKSQSVIAACLLALRIYGNNLKLHDFVERISTISMDEINNAIAKGDLDPLQIIVAEYTGQSSRRNKNGDAEPWLHGHARSTKFESQMIQMDFLMYWISKYIQSPKATWNFNKGIKPSDWQGAWEECFPGDDNE